jgi:hypothetical protein
VAARTGSTATTITHHYYYGDVIHGSKVGGDQNTVGNISGSSGIAIGRNASASVQIQHDAGSDEVIRLFEPLRAEVAGYNPTAVSLIQALEAQIKRGDEADDEKMADLIADIADAAPIAIQSLVNLFSSATVARVAGAGTKQALKWVQRQKN